MTELLRYAFVVLWHYITINSRHFKMEVQLKLPISQSTFSGPRKFALRYGSLK